MATALDDGTWHCMTDAPRDGTEVELLLRHLNFRYCKTDEERSQWEQVVRAKWIDHNGGGCEVTEMNEWTGDLDDDCTLERYGLSAHVECMDRGHWWFCVGRGEFPSYVELYNTADNETHVRLTTGKMARAAAECVMELLHSRPNG